MAVPAETAAEAPTQSPWLAVILAAIALASTLGVAYKDVLIARITTGRAKPADPEPAKLAPVPTVPAPPGPTPAGGHDNDRDAFFMVEDSFRDLRAQRDAATRRGDALQAELDRTRRQLTEAEVHIARLEARGRYG